MRKVYLSLIIIVIISLITNAQLFKKKSKGLPALTKQEISGEKLWVRITEETNYKKYPYWPNHKGLQPGQSPHGEFHKVFINPLLRYSLPIKNHIIPNGSIIVKENYSSDKRLKYYTVMAKVAGYDPKDGDWFWAMYGLDGSVKKAGKLKSCIGCHSGLKDNDYIIIYPLDKKP